MSVCDATQPNKETVTPSLDVKVFFGVAIILQCLILPERCCENLRIAIFAVLSAKFGDFTSVMGICCSSFVVINMGTSGRDYLTPEGNGNQPSVAASNSLLARTRLVQKVLYVVGKSSLFVCVSNGSAFCWRCLCLEVLPFGAADLVLWWVPADRKP